ncbi:hypothetical protein QQ045_023771 [Rhodiola kirilowii]
MDSRDSSSTVAPSSAAVSTESQSVDDDGVFNLAKDAAVYFQGQKYAECLQVLKQLLLKKPGNLKVLHNIAVTEYFCGGSDLRKLLNELCSVKTRCEELAHTADDSSEAGNNTGNESGSISKGISILMPGGEVFKVYTGEFDTSVASLNIATIWYHLREYAKALSTLEPLYQNIEPIEESIAQHICLLLLDAGLALQNATKSAEVLSYLERAFNGNASPSVIVSVAPNTSNQQSPNIVAKSTSIPAASDVGIADATANTNVVDNTLSRTLSEETIDYENLLSTLDIDRDNISRASGLSTSSNLSRPALDRSTSSPIIDLRLLQLYKVRFLLLTRNLKAIKREVKEAMNLTRGGDSTVALLLKSQFEYARGNYKKAIKLLVASNCQTDTALSSVCNNNFGCIYYQMGKFHTAAMFFSRALSNCSALRKDKQKKLLSLLQDESLTILYNCGLQYLACGKPILAAHCFQKASLVFSKQPLLWLRIAECCLLALEKGLLQSNGSSSESSEVKIRVIGRGKWRQLVMEDGAAKSGHNSSFGNGKLVEDKPINLSVSLARQSLLNALHLLNSSSRAAESSLASQMNLKDAKLNDVAAAGDAMLSNGDVKESKGGQGYGDTLRSSLVEFEQIRAREHQMIKQTLLGHLAYAELELRNPLKALSAAKSLLELPDCAGIYVFLGRVYAAEALCLLGRPKEAAEQLSTYMNEETGFVLPYKEEDCEPWKIKCDRECEESDKHTQARKSSTDLHKFTAFPVPEEARGILYVNFASLCARQGDLEQAHKFATQSLSAIPNYTKAILMVVYVNLMLGKTHEALGILKQCNRVTFLPSR